MGDVGDKLMAESSDECLLTTSVTLWEALSSHPIELYHKAWYEAKVNINIGSSAIRLAFLIMQLYTCC